MTLTKKVPITGWTFTCSKCKKSNFFDDENGCDNSPNAKNTYAPPAQGLQCVRLKRVNNAINSLIILSRVRINQVKDVFIIDVLKRLIILEF